MTDHPMRKLMKLCEAVTEEITSDDTGYLYHGTGKTLLIDIARDGLIPSEKSRWSRDVGIGDWSLGKVFFTDRIGNANFHAGQASKSHPALLRVRRDAVTDLKPDPKEKIGSFYSEQRIPRKMSSTGMGKSG